MNIVFNGFLDPRTAPIALKLLGKLKADSFVYTYNYFLPDFGRFNSKATLLYWRNINFHGDYGVDWRKLEPLDEELIANMRGCEAIILKMMDRLETMKNYSYRERKELYLKHLRFWNDLYVRGKIDFFISQNIPHETSDFVCYSLCRLKKIPTIIGYQTHIPDTTLIFDAWEKTDYGLPQAIKKFEKIYKGKRVESIKLSDRFEDYYSLQVSSEHSAAPFYMRKKTLPGEVAKKAPIIISKIKKDPAVYLKGSKVITQALFRKLVFYIKTRFLMNYYEKKCTALDLREKYLFVGLHVQPEMSTSPRADAYVEQLLVLQLLSACVPRNVKIFVKEHPNQDVQSRSRAYYDEILRLRNVQLVSRKSDSKKLVQASLAVVTGTGLVGFESLFHNKPVLMFGHDFFEYAPGAFAIRTKHDLEQALKIILKGPVFDQKEFKIFLKALESVSIHGTIDSDYALTSKLSDEVSLERVVEGIMREINRSMK